ncbi:MAG: exodeoxyribonuclease VII large subunit, partial [Actinobacteria bacterium]|nr:exodeoxyribonuclease VII large subunit [Actinomycetota bacterium]
MIGKELAEERNDDVKVDRVDVLSIGELYDRVEAALAATFSRGRGLWVRGELQSISDRTGHCYMDLVDPDSTRDRQSPVLKVKCWRNTWAQVKSLLLEEGIELQPGMVVLIRGTVDFYRPRAEVGFILSEIDITALIGRLAAQRAALLKALDSEGLIERNRRLSLADVPLRVGLIASPGTEGYRDFIGQIEHSGFSFKISVVPVTVQGPEAPAALAAAIGQFDATPVDLIVLVRGGGSKADLAGYDAEVLARAIAGARYPVWTGIGHTGDESVADIVSHRSF